MLFENIYGNTCGWKSIWKCVKYCLKTENGCLKTQIKHHLRMAIFYASCEHKTVFYKLVFSVLGSCQSLSTSFNMIDK